MTEEPLWIDRDELHLLYARQVELRNDIGTIEPGRIADLVVLNEKPLSSSANVRSVIVVRGGKAWTRWELEYR